MRKLLLGLAALAVLVGLVALTWGRGRSRSRVHRGPARVEPPLSQPGVEPQRSSRSDTQVTIPMPPEGTLKLLPGRFQIVSGADQIREFRLYRPKGSTEVETTIGRAPGDALTHVQLKSRTVSSKQAKLIYSANGYTLLNLATVNPTERNGTAMAAGETAPLGDGDRITMGEVQLVYSAQ